MSSGSAPPILEVAAAVISDDRGRVLVATRRAGAHLGGVSEFPGGKALAGESAEDACRRECREELGVEVVVHGLAAPRIVHAYPDRTVALSFFRCALAPGSGPPRALGAEALRWVERARLAELPWPEANRALVARLAREVG